MIDKPIIYYKKDCFNEPYCSLGKVIEQLDQLKTENEEYKKNGIDLFEQLSNGLKANEKLKAQNEQAEQTLAEIKEIANRIYSEVITENWQSLLAKQILQKISEVEDEN